MTYFEKPRIPEFIREKKLQEAKHFAEHIFKFFEVQPLPDTILFEAFFFLVLPIIDKHRQCVVENKL